MSKTGVYAFRNGKLVKISDRIPSLKGMFDVVFNGPYYDPTLGWIETKREKYEKMQERGLMQYDPQSINKRPKPTVTPEKVVETVLEKKGISRLKNWKGVKV